MKKETLKKIFTTVLISSMVFGMAGCGKTKSIEKKKKQEITTIEMAVSSDMTVSVDALKEQLKEAGYELNVTVFDDYIMPNQALAEGSVMCNFYQNPPYVDAYNESNGTDLVFVTPAILPVPYGVYSKNLSSLDELENGMKIAMPNAPTNRQRCLKMLEDAGVLKLAESPADEYYSQDDITSNPKNIEIIEIETFSLYALMDDVAAIMLPTQTYFECGGDASTAIYRQEDTLDGYYACGIVVRPEDKDSEWVKAIIEAGESEEFKKAHEERYPGVFNFEW